MRSRAESRVDGSVIACSAGESDFGDERDPLRLFTACRRTKFRGSADCIFASERPAFDRQSGRRQCRIRRDMKS